MWVLHAFFLGMTHATKKIMGINVTITVEFAKNYLFKSLKALLVAAAVFFMWRASRGGQKIITDNL